MLARGTIGHLNPVWVCELLETEMIIHHGNLAEAEDFALDAYHFASLSQPDRVIWIASTWLKLLGSTGSLTTLPPAPASASPAEHQIDEDAVF